MFSLLSPVHQFTLDITLITTLLVVSVHMTFRAGLFSMAPMGFAAIGGYTTAVLVTKYDWNPLASIALAPFGAALVAAVFAVPVLRLRGIYFALGTVALAQVIVILISNMDITNGVFGISRIPNVIETWHLILLVVVVLVFLQLESRSYFGRALAALRLDERTAEGLGVNVRWLRFTTFVTAAGIAGLAGALEAHRTTVISPGQYAFVTLVPIITYALVGGNGHWLGPVLTAWVLIVARQQMHFLGTTWEHLIYGSLLVLLMVFAPSGLTDPKLLRRVRRRKRTTLPSVDRSGTKGQDMAEVGAAGGAS